MIYELFFIAALSLESTTSASNDCANIYAHCDNELFVYLKHNDDLQLIGHSFEWGTYLQVSVSNITSNTMIQFKCIDSGVVGGFIATINYGGTLYSTTNPITNSNFDIMNDTTSSLVYSSKTSSPWNINTPYIANDAYWIWNGELYNTMTFLFNFANIPLITPSPNFVCIKSMDPSIITTTVATTTEDIFTTDFTPSVTAANGHYATVFVHCDNILKVYLSDTEQVDFKQIAYEERWEDYTKLVVTDITMNTLLRFECKDVGSIGGFIATVHYDGDNYSTTNPMEDGNFVLYSSSDGILSPLSYREKTSKPWNIDTHGIDDDAYWIWNGKLFNTMTFEFSFGDLLSNKICQNDISDWTINAMEGIPQFVLSSMIVDNYLDIKLRSISLIDADEMNSNDNYWLHNEYGSKFYLFAESTSLTLTAILMDIDMYIDSEPVCKNTLKLNINIETDLIVTREGVSYCMDVMSNMEDSDVERIDNTSFIWNEFEFKLDDNVHCDNSDNERVDIYRIKSINTLSICISHQLCVNSASYSLFVKYIDNDVNNDKNNNDDDDTSFDVGIGITVSIILLISLYCYHRYRKNKSVAQSEEKGKYENEKALELAVEMKVIEEDERYNDGRWYNEDVCINNTDNTKTEDLSYSAMHCVICLDVLLYHEECKLICGHKFHTHCIEEYNETNNQCPLCRQKIVISDIEKP